MILSYSMILGYSMIPSYVIRWSIGSMDFDNPKVYGDTSISDGLVLLSRSCWHQYQSCPFTLCVDWMTSASVHFHVSSRKKNFHVSSVMTICTYLNFYRQWIWKRPNSVNSFNYLEKWMLKEHNYQYLVVIMWYSF